MNISEGQGSMSEQRTVATRTELLELTKRHRVCWEVRPEYAYLDGSPDSRREIGYCVALFGTHDHPHVPPSPGCPECVPVREALAAILAFVRPDETHASHYDAHIEHGSLEYSKARGERPDVCATLTILHRNGVSRPVDDCEDKCLREILDKLRALGAMEGQWPVNG